VKAKSVVLRALASRDINEVIEHYLSQESEEAAIGFIDSLEQAYAQISRHPRNGSPHYAHELNLPGLRSWSLKRYPYLVFYVERSQHIDVWRVLHGQRDIPTWMQDADLTRLPE
jgi:toxin ParE1/3/4